MIEGKDLILILDFGSQYTQLIARRIREIGIYSIVKSYDTSLKDIQTISPKGIILSGGPNSVNFKKTLNPDKEIFKSSIPILGICYGMQLIGKEFGGSVVKSEKKEFGHSVFHIKSTSLLLKGCKKNESFNVWMSHSDKLLKAPKNFRVLGESTNSKIAAIENTQKHIYGLQLFTHCM